MSYLYISDDFKTLETYFFGDAIGQANDLIADKVELAWDMISSSTVPYQTSVNSDGTQLTREYATDASAHNRAPDPSPAPTPNYAPLLVNNDDELLTIQLDIV